MMMDVRELVTKFSFQVNSKAVKDFIGLLAKAETSLDNLGKKTNIKVADVKLQKQLAQLKTQELKSEAQAIKNQSLKLKGDGIALKNQGIKIRNENMLGKIEKKRQSDELKLIQTRKKEMQAIYRGIFKAGKNNPTTEVFNSMAGFKVRNAEKAHADFLKNQTLEARKAEKESLDYETRRSKVLQRHSVSRLKRRIRNANQPTPTGGGGGGFSLADTYFNLQLLKDAYQVFYNIAEATRQTAVNILRTNDALSMSIAKIGVITGDTKNASKNFKELLDISAQTGSEIGVIEEIFNRLSMGKEGLGASTEQIIDFTSAIAKMSAFSEGGAAQQGALRQLGQMFGGAYIQAQEWNSIVDGLPMVAIKIAKAMGTTREAMTFKIRQQTKDSPAYLISDIFPKLLKILPEIEAEFKNLPPTLDRTLNKAGVGLLKFSLNLKESVKMPELDAFYSRLDGTIQKIFKWADANKALIGTNINSFFGTLGDVLGSVDTQLKDTKGTAKILNDTFYVLNETVKFLKGTFDTLLWTLQAIKPLMEWIQKHPTATNVTVGAGGGAIIGGRVAGPIGAGVGAVGGGIAGLLNSPMVKEIFSNPKDKQAYLNKYGNSAYGNVLTGNFFNKNPQAGFGTKGGGVTVVQNNNFTGSSATKGEQKQTASLVGGSASHGVRKAILAGGVK